MTAFTLEPLAARWQPWAEAFITREWGSLRMVSRGVLYNLLEYPGFLALVDGQPQALAIYRIEAAACELLLLHSNLNGLGIGSALVEQVAQAARQAGCGRLWLITTNDNLAAIRWYQRRGFTLAALHVNALAVSRRLKPEIPLIGYDGIPLRDEIEFERLLGGK